MIYDLDEFISKWNHVSSDPYKVIMLYLLAALNIEKNLDEAENMMTVIVSKKDCLEDNESPTGLTLGRSAGYFLRRFQDNPNIARSYLGGSPENNYQVNESNLELTVLREEEINERLKIFIKSKGKDFLTPVQVQKNRDNEWKLVEYSSICTGVKKPLSEQNDF
jgi:hypothetical protein